MIQDSVLEWKDGTALLNGSVAAYFQNTFGLEPDEQLEILNEYCKKNPKAKAYFIAEAYDKAHNTNYKQKLCQNVL